MQEFQVRGARLLKKFGKLPWEAGVVGRGLMRTGASHILVTEG